MNKILCFLVVMFGSVTIANAACTKSSIVGTWKIKITDREGCEVTIQKDGKLKNSSCEKSAEMMLVTGNSPYPVTGNLTVDSSCNVIGSIRIDKTSGLSSIQEFVVEGNLNTKGNDVFIGALRQVSPEEPSMINDNFYSVRTK